MSLLAQLVELEIDVIATRSAATPLGNFDGDGARHHVAPGQVFGVRRVAFHETLAVPVQQIAALAAHALGDQAADTRDAGGMKLPEFHVLQRQAGAQHHAEAIAGVDHGIAAVPEHAPCPAGGEQRGARLDQQRLAGLDAHCRHAQTIALGVTQQIEREIFVEELGAVLDVLLIQRMQQRMAGAVGGGAGAGSLLAAEVLGLTTERALVDLAVVQPRKRQPHVFQFIHGRSGFAAHEFDRILVAQPVAALDRVVHVPFPAVVVDVGQRGGDAALRRHGVRAGGEHLGDDGDGEIGARQLQRRTQTRAAAADDERVEAALVHAAFHTTAASHATLPARVTITSRLSISRRPIG